MELYLISTASLKECAILRAATIQNSDAIWSEAVLSEQDALTVKRLGYLCKKLYPQEAVQSAV